MLFTVTLNYRTPSGTKTHVSKVKASGAQVAIDRALKRAPEAVVAKFLDGSAEPTYLASATT